jgi:hypothetical protein
MWLNGSFAGCSIQCLDLTAENFWNGAEPPDYHD